jgi:hypothetical protein
LNTIFIGGSRNVSRLPLEVKTRLDNVVSCGHQVIIGDANGADKAVQKHLHERHYNNVTVYCSGETPRNNLGTWPIHRVDVPKDVKGFHFFAAKDRAMAQQADFGLMIWDGTSSGTLLNVLRLALAGKIAVLFSVPEKHVFNIKSLDIWKDFYTHCSVALQKDVRDRATPDEWKELKAMDQSTFSFVALEDGPRAPDDSTTTNLLELSGREAIDKATEALNEAFASGNRTAIIDALSLITSRERMEASHRKTTYAGVNHCSAGLPELTKVIDILSSVGLRLEVKAKEKP